ncbi:MAG: hypothetical protein QXJ64_03195 [Thermosphaera sp.]
MHKVKNRIKTSIYVDKDLWKELRNSYLQEIKCLSKLWRVFREELMVGFENTL